MLEWLTSYKQELSPYITAFLEQKKPTYSKVNAWGKISLERLTQFAISGKMIRGALVLLAHDIAIGEEKASALKIGAALELTHSALLIHDDIIDNDTTRRGAPTIFSQFATLAKQKQIATPNEFGKAAGICIGDIGFYLGFELLSSLTLPTREKILNLFSQELQLVGLAELEDVFFGQTTKIPSETAILNAYKYKTGRYTFSLPLMLGALLAGADENTLKTLEQFGEELGVLFQIIDDQLSIFGNQHQTGKPVGTDISRGNKTLYYLYLFEKSKDPKTLQRIFGSGAITEVDLQFVQTQIKMLGIDRQIQQMIATRKTNTLTLLQKLPFTIAGKHKLKELVEFTLSRQQ